MKKKKQAERPKEFKPAPFANLKGFQPSSPASKSQPASSPPPKPKEEVSPDDSILFLREMAGVKRLAPAPAGRKEGAPVSPPSRQFEEEDRRAFADAMSRLKLDVDFRDELPEEAVPYKPRSANRMRQLRRGAIRLDLELDLHGLTREEALESLALFITGAYNRGQQAVLVITGKGNHSPEEPVLQRAVAGWLREQGKTMVAEFAPAPRQMGGSGAFVVFLREGAPGQAH